MFFELHEEGKIGYKMISKSELGNGDTSHQTHIGLSQKVLTFLPDCDKEIEDCLFIYNDSFSYLSAYFSKIEQNKTGKFRSPYIKTGGLQCVSVVSVIRDIVDNSEDNQWFLIWFALKNEKVVFSLFNKSSKVYEYISGLGLNLEHSASAIKDFTLVKSIVEYVKPKTDGKSTSVIDELKDLEINSQIGGIGFSKKLKGYDIEKANANFIRIGRNGEELINEFLKKKVLINEILHFTWYNEEKESGLPYDFSIENHNGNIVYLDVKTTKFDFSQKIIFSSQEIDFITNYAKNYSIYRVYNGADNLPYVRICDDCKSIANKINALTNEYRNSLSQADAYLQNAKLAISPESKNLKFKQGILL